jgi:hypothetical protein
VNTQVVEVGSFNLRTLSQKKKEKRKTEREREGKGKTT